MKKPEYTCIITSNFSWGREYTVTTKSAMKCANLYGRCEGGEVVTIQTKSGRIISRVRYHADGKYYRETIFD